MIIFDSNELVVSKLINTYYCNECVKRDATTIESEEHDWEWFGERDKQFNGAIPDSLDELCLDHGVGGMNKPTPVYSHYILFHPDTMIEILTKLKFPEEVSSWHKYYAMQMITPNGQIPLVSEDACYLAWILEEMVSEIDYEHLFSVQGVDRWTISLHCRPSPSYYRPTEGWGGSKMLIIEPVNILPLYSDFPAN